MKTFFPSEQIQDLGKSAILGSTETFLSLHVQVSNLFPSSHTFAFVIFFPSLAITPSLNSTFWFC